jgi:hypothetical protein
MDEFEFQANMELGKVYLEVMNRVVKEGFDFISPELELWQDYSFLSVPGEDFPDSNFGRKAAELDGKNLLSRTGFSVNEASDASGEDKIGDHGIGIIWEIDPETGKRKEYAVELDESYFDSVSLQERVGVAHISFLFPYFSFQL